MLENPSDLSSLGNNATIKRYAPPNQRNRLSRRKSGGDHFERISSNYTNDGEKNQVATQRNVAVSDHGNAVGSNCVNENPPSRLIPLEGCCKSEASVLLNDRWTAAINAFNDPSTDFAEKPVMYSGSGASAWGNFRLPHQMLMPPTPNAGPLGTQTDFLSELRRAMHDADAGANC